MSGRRVEAKESTVTRKPHDEQPQFGQKTKELRGRDARTANVRFSPNRSAEIHATDVSVGQTVVVQGALLLASTYKGSSSARPTTYQVSFLSP